MNARSEPNHRTEAVETQRLKSGSAPHPGDIVINDELIIALAENGLSFFRVGLRSFSIMACELTPERQRELAKAQTLSDDARKRCEGQ